MICLGRFDHIINDDSYDVGAVLNFNRVDLKQYGPITFSPIDPTEYLNCGLVAMRSKPFVQHWLNLCNGPYFQRLQYREQDLLNILAHFGDYRAKCFDHKQPDGSVLWNGLISKGEYHRTELRNGEVWLPASEDQYPIEDVRLTFIHNAGGQGEKKVLDSFRVYFPEAVADHIHKLIQ